MPDLTPNIGLKIPLPSENVSKQSYSENLTITDQAVGETSNKIGNLALLTTTDKTSLVHAVNEVKATATIAKAKANDVQITSTSPQTVATFTPPSKNNYMVTMYFRVVTDTTNVTVTVTYTDGTGAQTNTLLNAQAQAVGSYSLIPLFINATNSAINVNITASVANRVYASASILEV